MDLLQEARRLYESGRMHDALEAAQAACDRHPKDAEAWLLLARVSRHTRLPGASDAAFRRAAALSAGGAVPVRVSRDRFQEMLRQAIAGLEPDARRRLAGGRVQVEALPRDEQVRAGVDPDALSQRVDSPEARLILYQANLENRAASESALQDLISRTLEEA